MKLKPYPKYKPSGVEWLGNVPEAWTETLIKHEASFFGGGTPSKDEPLYWNGNIPWVSPKDMKTDLVVDTEDHVTELGMENSPITLVPAKCVLLVVRSGILKHTIPVALNEVPVTLNQDMKGVLFGRKVHSPFFMRWVQGNNSELLLEWAKQGATVESIEHTYFANSRIFLPPLRDQIAITTFLDRETVKIATLIAKQEKLIELLQEKRQAVIFQAVTKGLDQTLSMKPSGVEWLGDVPAHWDVVKGSQIGDLFGSLPLVEEDLRDEGEFAYIKVSSLSNDSFEIAQWDWFVQTDAVGRAPPKSNFVVFPKRGAAIFTNKVNIVRRSALLDPNLMGWQMYPTANLDFVAFLLKARGLSDLADVSTVPQINNKHILPQRFPLPPLEEQICIALHLKVETTKIDALMSKAQQAIELQKEHRTALISAAVTGKIDVRHGVEEEACQENAA